MGANILLYIVADISGSMGEAAKLYILRNLINYIRERLHLSNNNLSFNKICVITWNEKVKYVKIDSQNNYFGKARTKHSNLWKG